MSDLITNKNYKFNPYIYEKKQSIFAGIGVAVVTPFTENDEITEEITLLNFSGDAVATPTTGRFEAKVTFSETAVAV